MLNETLRNYEQESQWLNSEYHKTVLYIPGKAVTVTDSGEYAFYLLRELDAFTYGADVESKYLYSIFSLSRTEQEQCKLLQSVNRAAPAGIHVVYQKIEHKVPTSFSAVSGTPPPFTRLWRRTSSCSPGRL